MTLPTTALRNLLRRDAPILVPGVYDALTAKLAQLEGFPVVHVGGYAVSATHLGLPDISFLTMTEMLWVLRNITASVDMPVIADGDTGYGNFLNVRRLIRELERARVAGVHIEDQVFPKRCGHLEGKRVVSTGEMVDKVKAAVDARADPDFVIIARTDSLAVHGLEDALERGRAYAEAGADIVFIEAPETVEQVRTIPKMIPVPVLYNWAYTGKSPALPFSVLGEMGYKLVLFTDTVFAATKAVIDLFKNLKESGTYDTFSDRMIAFEKFNTLIGLREVELLEQRYSGS